MYLYYFTITDVIGIVKDVQDRRCYMKDDKEKSYIKFRLTDGRLCISLSYIIRYIFLFLC